MRNILLQYQKQFSALLRYLRWQGKVTDVDHSRWSGRKVGSLRLNIDARNVNKPLQPIRHQMMAPKEVRKQQKIQGGEERVKNGQRSCTVTGWRSCSSSGWRPCSSFGWGKTDNDHQQHTQAGQTPHRTLSRARPDGRRQGGRMPGTPHLSRKRGQRPTKANQHTREASILLYIHVFFFRLNFITLYSFKKFTMTNTQAFVSLPFFEGFNKFAIWPSPNSVRNFEI